MAKFKLNWGWSILIVYATFMIVFLFFFYRSFKELESNELVTDNYYEKELVYGEVLDKKKNADTMRIPVQIIQNADALKIVFPKYIKDIKGSITLYKPDNQNLDKKFSLTPDSLGVQRIDQLIPGRWNISIDWKTDNIAYFMEKSLTIK